MIEMLSWMAVKTFLKKGWAWCKKYWQFLLGLSVGLAVLAVTRDRTRLSKAFKKFKESSDAMIQNSIKIEQSQDEKTLAAVEKYKKDLENAQNESNQRDDLARDEKKEIRDSLLEREQENPGTIASEISNALKDIN